MEKKEKSTETVNLSGLIKEHSQMFNTTRRESAWAIESTLALFNKKLRIDKANLSLSKFGRFYQKTIKSKRLKNPSTGEHFVSEPKEVVRFTQSENPF